MHPVLYAKLPEFIKSSELKERCDQVKWLNAISPASERLVKAFVYC